MKFNDISIGQIYRARIDAWHSRRVQCVDKDHEKKLIGVQRVGLDGQPWDGEDVRVERWIPSRKVFERDDDYRERKNREAAEWAAREAREEADEQEVQRLIAYLGQYGIALESEGAGKGATIDLHHLKHLCAEIESLVAAADPEVKGKLRRLERLEAGLKALAEEGLTH